MSTRTYPTRPPRPIKIVSVNAPSNRVLTEAVEYLRRLEEESKQAAKLADALLDGVELREKAGAR